MLKYLIYDADGNLYDVRFESDGWSLAKVQDVYSPFSVKVIEQANG
jgi:hypothetical protein